MPMFEWAELVTRTVRKCLPDVRAVRKGTNIVWKLGDHRAILEPAGATWWMRIDATSRWAGTRTYDERHSEQSARVAASNIVVHFDPRYCRGFDVEPYTREES